MTKNEAILGYKTAMVVFKKWHSDGIISEMELAQISTTIAAKYGLSSGSIYLENDLLCRENRANMMLEEILNE